MEPVFENRFLGNRKIISEFAWKYSVGPRPWTLFLYVPLMVLSLGTLVIPGFSGNDRLRAGIFLVCLVALQAMPLWYAWAVLHNDKRKNDGVQPETVTTFGDAVEVHEGMVHLTVEYRKIVQVVRLKHSYALMTGKRTAVLITPEGFTKGSFGEFKQFLRMKCPDLVIPE